MRNMAVHVCVNRTLVEEDVIDVFPELTASAQMGVEVQYCKLT